MMICVPKSLIINLIFLILLIVSYLYLEDKTDLFQLNLERRRTASNDENKILEFYEKLNESERIINAKTNVENIVDGIFVALKKKDKQKNFIKIISNSGIRTDNKVSLLIHLFIF